MKGQIKQVFLYIFAAIVIGLLLLIGYRSIGGLFEQACDVERVQFKSDLENLIERSNTYGSFQLERIPAPCDAEAICFVDARNISDSNFVDPARPVIEESVTSGVEMNVFLTGAFIDPVLYKEELVLPEQYWGTSLCINTSGNNFRVGFRGLGRHTQVERPPPTI